jgi:hypothetical protein
MTTEPVDHCTYIIRAWKEPTATSAADQWRFVLLAADSKQREGFVAIEQLLSALHTELRTLTQESRP